MKVQAALVYKGKSLKGNTKIGLEFDDMVTVTESFFPPASIPTFMAEIGGILGLWLGVGTLQIFVQALEYFNFVRSNVRFY